VAVVDANLSNVSVGIVAGIGVLASVPFTVDGGLHSTITVSTAIAISDGLTINTDGGNITLETGLLAVGALSGTTVDINDGGTFQTNAGLITANVLTGTHIGFGTGGGTDVISNTATGFLDVNLLTAVGAITGFGTGDSIVDAALNNGEISGYTITPESGGVQTITVMTSGANNGTLTFEIDDASRGGSLTSGSFAVGAGPLHISADGGGIQLTLCFLGGTMIATPYGEAAVETLQPGDLVLTADGNVVPVRWIGINTVATRFADPKRSMPIHIMPGALGEGLPKRDLKLSPDHALLLDGVLVQAGALVNDLTIHRVGWMPEQFRYYHIEMAAHDLIIAEGVAAETFVDNVSRMAFDNWQEFLDICNGEPPTGEMAYPRARSQRQLPPPLRARLAAGVAQLRAQTAA